jgi:hypothetical protein
MEGGSFPGKKKYKGYTLLACDGSDINISRNQEDKDTYFQSTPNDKGSNGMISGYPLPKQEEFDINISTTLTRKQTNEIKRNNSKYKFVPKTSTFDYLDLHKNKFYPITLRIVRLKLSENSYESIITNLDKKEFPAERIKELYHLRWGIETSFRELKYAIGLSNFHAKKVAYITQEILARMIMYNFCELITTSIVLSQKDTKYNYQVNYTMAIHICRYFLKNKDKRKPPDVETLIRRYILPVRMGRHDPRKVRVQSSVSFLYGVA